MPRPKRGFAPQVGYGITQDIPPQRDTHCCADYGLGNRAECVMLNKGPHIVAAVHALDDILHRMQDHQSKKMPMLRPLRMTQNMK